MLWIYITIPLAIIGFIVAVGPVLIGITAQHRDWRAYEAGEVRADLLRFERRRLAALEELRRLRSGDAGDIRPDVLSFERRRQAALEELQRAA